MIKEILFRGKCIEDNCDKRGEWVYGYFVYCHDEYEFDEPRVAEIIETDAARSYTGEYNYWKAHSVNPETVGQYIGLKDAKDNKIFEGDVLTNCRTQCVIGYLESSFTYRHIGSMYEDCIDDNEYGMSFEDYEIIGNIWDNPELLEVEKNG